VFPPYRSYVLISRGQLASNYRAVRKLVGPEVDVAAVVKADGYGHGALEVARVVVGEGARWLAVSSVDEGVQLRSGGIEGVRILVMGGFLDYESGAMVAHDLTPAVHSLEQIRRMDELAAACGMPLRFHLKVDSAADYTTDQTAGQLAYFHCIHEYLQAAGIRPEMLHTSSTIAVAYGRREGWHSLVRTGHALYGYVSPARGSAPESDLRVAPALTWKARLLAVKEIPAGALVGYGGTFRAPSAMRIGIVGAGYADGMFHRLSNRGKVIAAGKLTPILGTISMDLTTIDLSHTEALRAGDEVTLLGAEGDCRLEAPQIARVAGTISYNILCSISARVRRVYTE
jgi:alanine racemase